MRESRGRRVSALLLLVWGLSFFVSLSLKAQVAGESWTKIAVLGGNSTAVVVSPDYQSDQTVFVGTAGAGVWRSQDGGQTWTRGRNSFMIALQGVADIAISPGYPTDPTLFVLTTKGGIYRSIDAKGNFSFSYIGSIGVVGTALAISPDFQADGVVFAAGVGSGLWYTTSRGNVWNQDTSTPINLIMALGISPAFAADQTLFVGGSSKTGCFWRRVGVTTGSWAAVDNNLGIGVEETVIAIAVAGPTNVFAGTYADGMWVSSDTGRSWTAACDGVTSMTAPSVNTIAFASSLLLEGRSDTLRQSTDVGTTCSITVPHTGINDITFEPGWDGSTRCDIYVATPAGLFKKTCPVPLGAKGPKAVSARAVAMIRDASGGARGTWIGSGDGLFKAKPSSWVADEFAMVQYNNFPNGLTPEIVAVCLDPAYDEAGACGTDAATLFVAANFPTSAPDNGVYKSTDFGNTWTKMVGGDWPTSSISMNDLAISPVYLGGSQDTTLYAATSMSLFRWDGGTTYWTNVRAISVDVVGLPPTYNRAGTSAFPNHTVFISYDGGVWFSEDDGTEWIATGYPALPSGYRVTGFAFPADFGASQPNVFASSNYSPSQFYYSSDPPPWKTWSAITTGLPAGGVYDLAASPGFLVSDKLMVCATPSGVYLSTNAGTGTNTWTSSGTPAALSVAFDPTNPAGNYVIAGLVGKGAVFSSNGGNSFPRAYTGYGSLPNDVFETLAHTRDPNILFASSPTYGVFVSENKGLSFRPWNKGIGGSSGPCVLTDALGLGMMVERAGPNWPGWDVVWVGTKADGIKYRWLRYDPTTGAISLDGYSWYNTGQSTGRFERFDTLGAGQDNPAWAASPDLGMFRCPNNSWGTWTPQNGGMPVASGNSVVFGYNGADTILLTSGQTISGQVVYNGWNYYVINVPTGTTDLHVFMDDLDNYGPMDPDMYVRFGAKPDLYNYDFRPYINDDENVCVTSFTLLNENFDESWGPYGNNPPPGWTIEDYGSENPKIWNTNDWYGFDKSGNGTNYVARVYYYPVENQNEYLISPTFNVPSTAGSVNLEFDHYFNHYASASYDNGYVLYKSDQHTSWVTLATYTATSANMEHVTIPLTSYIGDTNAQIAFRYVANNSWEWQIDNVKVSGTNIKAGAWYIGIHGYSQRTAGYELTATLNSGCIASFAAALPRKESYSARSTNAFPKPKAPSGGIVWGTVFAHGVTRGVDSGGTVTWTSANGSGSTTLSNLNSKTVLQISDLTVIAGCNGGVFYSPAPDEGATTWVDSTSNIASAGSNDFTDLIEAPNGDVLISADGTGSGTSAGGVWLSGDKGRHWMKISSGFDSSSQKLSDLMVDSSDPPQYYSSTDGTGVYTRTITASAYPTVTGLSPNSDDVDGGATVTVTGTGFSNSCPTGTASDCPDSSPVVLFGDTEVSTTWVSSTQLTCTAPAHAASSVTVTVRNPDTRQSKSGRAFTYGCKAMGSATNNLAADLDPYADTGVEVTWSQNVSEWGDGGGVSDRSYGVYRNGSLIANVSYGTTNYTDATGTNGVSYVYKVRYINACGSYIETTGASASDEYNVPEEVLNTSVKWDSGTQLSWSAATGATAYRVYRGDSSELAGLPTGAKVCKAYDGDAANTGSTLAAEPAGGDFYWYLVAPYNGAGEGSVGVNRTFSSTGACP